jgi:hypothetical protein
VQEPFRMRPVVATPVRTDLGILRLNSVKPT